MSEKLVRAALRHWAALKLVAATCLHGAEDGTSGSSASTNGEPVLLARLVRRVFDRNGRCWQRVARCRPLALAEYDTHCD